MVKKIHFFSKILHRIANFGSGAYRGPIKIAYLVPTCRPVVNNVVDFNIKFFNLYRHKYATTTSYSINSQTEANGGVLALELDGQAIVFRNTCIETFRADLSESKRLNIGQS